MGYITVIPQDIIGFSNSNIIRFSRVYNSNNTMFGGVVLQSFHKDKWDSLTVMSYGSEGSLRVIPQGLAGLSNNNATRFSVFFSN